jgi:hypothetical protein
MSLVKEFWDFMKARKKFMLAPVIVVLVVLSGLLALAAGSQVLSPVLYMFF